MVGAKSARRPPSAAWVVASGENQRHGVCRMGGKGGTVRARTFFSALPWSAVMRALRPF